MAKVMIDSGPVDALWELEETPPEKWKLLMACRRDFMARKLTYDCRCLVKFIKDAKQMWQPLGYKDIKDFIQHGYELNPEEIQIAVRWLEINSPKDAIGIDKVVELAKWGRPKKGDEKKGDNITFSQRGTNRAYILARLERDQNIDLINRIKNGELSAHAAAIEAGWRKNPTVVDRLKKLWNKANSDDRIEFREWMDRTD